MFQQTIQDVLAIAEASGRADEILKCVGTRIAAFEPFAGAELLAETAMGRRRFVITQGLGEAGAKALSALKDEPTLRVDTAADMRALHLSTDPALVSLLALRIGAPGASTAAIVLGHSRAWSFAGTPLSRVRTIGQVALRLLLPASAANNQTDDTARLTSEVSRLLAHVSTLEKEINSFRAAPKPALAAAQPAPSPAPQVPPPEPRSPQPAAPQLAPETQKRLMPRKRSGTPQ